MAEVRLESEASTVVAVVPESLVTYIRQWARLGEHAEGDVVLSLLNHGVMQVLMVQNLGPELNSMATKITKDMAEMAPSEAKIIEVCMSDGDECPNCGQRH